MMLDISVKRETVWTWQPGRMLRASESNTPVSDGERIHRTLKRVAKARASLDSQEAAALREAQRIRLWEQFGYTSLVDYMERELGYTARSAVDRLRVANAIEDLPQVEAALEQGTLSFSGARALAPVVVPDTQEKWLAATHGKNVRQIEEMVAGRKPGDLPTDPVDDGLRTTVLRFEVKLDTAALVRDYQKKRARQLGKLMDDDLLMREVFQLALDRLVELRRKPAEVGESVGARGSVEAVESPPSPHSPHSPPPHSPPSPPSPATLAFSVSPATPAISVSPATPAISVSSPYLPPSSSPTATPAISVSSPQSPPPSSPPPAAPAISVSMTPRHQVAVTVCNKCNRGWLNAAGTSSLLAPAELALAQCDYDDIGRVDLPGRPRKRSSIPPAIKRKVVARDEHRCRVPGCRSTNIDAHHILPFALGGSHDDTNLITLCEAHHLAIHRGTLLLNGAAPNFTFTFAAANRFTIETRVVETKRALEQRGLTKQEAARIVDAVRAHVGAEPLSSPGWLALAVSMSVKRPPC